MAKLTRNQMFDLLNICEDRREHGEDTRFSTDNNGVVIAVLPTEYSMIQVKLFLHIPFEQGVVAPDWFPIDFDQMEVCDLTFEQAKEILTSKELWDTESGYFDNVTTMVDSWREVA